LALRLLDAAGSTQPSPPYIAVLQHMSLGRLKSRMSSHRTRLAAVGCVVPCGGVVALRGERATPTHILDLPFGC